MTVLKFPIGVLRIIAPNNGFCADELHQLRTEPGHSRGNGRQRFRVIQDERFLLTSASSSCRIVRNFAIGFVGKMRIKNFACVVRLTAVLLALLVVLISSAIAQGNSVSGFVWGPGRTPIADVLVELQNEMYVTVQRTRT